MKLTFMPNMHQTRQASICVGLAAWILTLVLSSSVEADITGKHGAVMARTVILRDGKPILVEYDKEGKDVGEVEYTGPFADITIMSSYEYDQHKKRLEEFKTHYKDTLAKDARALTAEQVKGESFLTADGKSIATPSLTDAEKSVFVRGRSNSIVLGSTPSTGALNYPELILLRFPIDITQNIEVEKEGEQPVGSVVLDKKGQVIKKSKNNIAPRVGYFGGKDDPTQQKYKRVGNEKVEQLYLREREDKIFGGVGGVKVYISPEVFPGSIAVTESGADRDGRYNMQFHLPYCPGGFEFTTDLWVELYYSSFSPFGNPYRPYYLRRQDWTYCFDPFPPGPNLFEQMAYIDALAIKATLAIPSYNADFKVDVMFLSGRAFFVGPGGEIPVSTSTEYNVAMPEADNKTTVEGSYDLDGDGISDTVYRGKMVGGQFVRDNNGDMQGVNFSSHGGKSNGQPDVVRIIDTRKALGPNGLLKSISKEDFQKTDIMVFRESTGELVLDRKGLTEEEAKTALLGSDTGLGKDGKYFFYRLMLRGPNDSALNVGGNLGSIKDANNKNVSIRSLNWKDFATNYKMAEPFQKREADHLKSGEVVRVVIINRPTGYIGTQRVRLSDAGVNKGSALSVPIDDIALLPPKLKIWAERDFTNKNGFNKNPVTNIIGAEGASLMDDNKLVVYTEWVDQDGRPLPEGLGADKGAQFGLSGRLAKSIGGSTLNSVAGDMSIFPIAPGFQAQVLQLNDNLTAKEHYYIHVSGMPKSDKPDFSGGNLADNFSARPKNPTPFLTPVFFEGADWASITAWNNAKKAFNQQQSTIKPTKPLPYYEWLYRPEYQFSRYDLEIADIKRTLDDGSMKSLSTDPDNNAVGASDQLLNIFYSLQGNGNPLSPVDGPQDLVFAMGAEEIKATIGPNGQVRFNNIEHLASLQAQDLLTLRLYSNQDAGNVLWEHAFETYGVLEFPRTDVLAQFNGDSNGKLKIDSYTEIAIPLETESAVQVNLLDKDKSPESTIVPPKVLPFGMQNVIILRRDVQKLTPRAGPDGYIEVTIIPTNGEPARKRTYSVDLIQRVTGEMLGQVIEYDTLIQRGSLTLRREDFVLPGAGPQLSFTRSYSNETKPENDKSPLSPGWSHNHDIFLQVISEGDGLPPYENNLPNWIGATRESIDQPRYLDKATLDQLKRHIIVPTMISVTNGGTFKLNGASWVAQRGNHGFLEQKETGWEFRSKDGTVYTFESPDFFSRKAYVKTITDRNGNALAYGPYLNVNNEKLIQKITDAAGRSLNFTYSLSPEGKMQLDKVENKHGDVVLGVPLEFTYFVKSGAAYDARLGMLKSFNRGTFTESYDYRHLAEDPTVNLSTVTDANGQVTRYEYYAGNDVPPQLMTFAPGVNRNDVVHQVFYPVSPGQVPAEIKYTVTNTNNTREVFDLRGNKKTYTLNGHGNPIRLDEPESKSTTFEWSSDMKGANGLPEPDNLLRRKTDIATDSKWEYQYDAHGNLTKEIDPYDKITEQTWDQNFSVLLYRKDKNGDVLNQTPDAQGNILLADQTATVNGVPGISVKTEHTYGSAGPFKGLLRTTKNGRGSTTNFTYDSATGILNNIKEPEGSETQYEINSHGLRISEKDASGNVKSYLYDDLDRVTKITDAEGNTTDYTYDEKGNKKTEETRDSYYVDGTKHNRLVKLTYSYDGRDRVRTVVRTGNLDGSYSLTGTKTYTYDGNSNLLTESDWKGVSSTHGYDKLNRRVSTENRAGDSMATGYAFTGEGLTTTTTDYQGRVTKQFSDKLGRQVKVVHPTVTNSDGSTATYSREMTYDNLNNVTKLVDENGNTTNFEYDARNLKIKQTNAEGKNYVWQYDAAGNLSKTLDELSRETAYTYDKQNRLILKLTPANQKWQYTYNPNGTLKTETDPWKFFYSYTYNNINQRTSVTHPDGIDTESYTNDGKLVYKLDAGGREISSLYGPEGRLQQSTDARGRVTTNTYDENNNLIDTTIAWSGNTSGPAQVTVHNEYDSQDRLSKSTSAYGSSIPQLTEFTYDKLGNTTDVSKPEGRITHMEYDERNRVKRIKTAAVDGLNQEATQVWDGMGNKVSVTDRRGNTTTTEYDILNRPKTVTDADGKVISYSYDFVGNLLAETDRRGNVTEHSYDGLNRELERFASGSSPKFRLLKNEYDIGNTKKNAVTDANGNKVVSTQDWRGNTLVTTLPAGSTGGVSYPTSEIINVYDKSGFLTRSTDAAGFETHYTYYADGSVATSMNAENETTAFEYDLFGNKAKITKPKGKWQTLIYDEQKRLIQVKDALNGITSFEYDSNNNLRFQHLPAANDPDTMVEYTYDALNRKRSHKQPGGLASYFEYDAEGNLTKTTDAKGQVFTVTYDALNRLTNQTFPSGSDVTSIINTYDENGNVKNITEFKAAGGSETTTHDYDLLNRLIAQNQRGHAISYTYDNNGNRTQVTSIGGSTGYSYDSRNRLSTVTGASPTNYQYLANGWLQKVTHGNGTAVAYTYDNTGRVKTINNTLANNSLLSSFAYSYDANGNRSQQVETQHGFLTAQTVTTDYSYDDLDRLSGFTETSGATVTSHAFTYYPSYDRKTEKVVSAGTTLKERSYDYNGVYWLTKITEAAGGTISYQYDNNGNTTRKTDTTASADAPSTVFSYNSRNQLHSVAQGLAGAEFGQGTYAYNYAGLRTRHLGSERGDIEYLYDDDSVIDELQNNSTSLVAHYRYGDRLLSLTSGGSDQFYHYAGLGTTANLTNAAGEEQIAYRTDPFGEITHQEGTSVNRHVFTGQEHDEKTGLIYFGARFYDPDTARFINQDSYLGESSTPPSLHRYLYANSNPTMYIDKTGNYAEAGHYYTTYNVALAVGYSSADARRLALYSQLPDIAEKYDATNQGVDQVDITIKGYSYSNEAVEILKPSQMDTHSLLPDASKPGMSKKEASEANAQALRNERAATKSIVTSKDNSLEVKGFAIHKLADTYAHTYKDAQGNEVAYKIGLGHKEDGHTPDEISENPAKYKSYVKDLARALAISRGVDPKDITEEQLDRWTKPTISEVDKLMNAPPKIQRRGYSTIDHEKFEKQLQKNLSDSLRQQGVSDDRIDNVEPAKAKAVTATTVKVSESIERLNRVNENNKVRSYWPKTKSAADAAREVDRSHDEFVEKMRAEREKVEAAITVETDHMK